MPKLIEDEFKIEALNQFNYNNIIGSIKMNENFYNELHKFIKKVKNINKDFIENIMKNIPNDWNVSNKEKSLLVDYIYKRFNRVDEILNLLSIKGGDNSEI